MSRIGVRRGIDRGRLRQLLATSSFAALLLASGAPAWALMKAAPGSPCSIVQDGGTAASLSNSSPSGNCILVENNASVAGNVTNSGILDALVAAQPSGTGITVNHSTVGGSIINAGRINATSAGVAVTNHAVVSGGITNSSMITAYSTGIIVSGATVSGTISNSGAISSTDIGGGVIVTGGAIVSGGISNSGTLSVSDGSGIVVTDATMANGISNSGIISADSDGILVEGSVVIARRTASQLAFNAATNSNLVFSGGISNSGAITAGANGIAVVVAASSGGTATIATVSGGISNSGMVIAVEDDQKQTFTNANELDQAAAASNIGGGNGIWVGGQARSTNTGASATISNFSGGIANSGAVTASNVGIMVGGHAGLSVNGAVNGTVASIGSNASSLKILNFTGGITNSGMVTASDVGIGVGGGASVNVNVTATGASVSGKAGASVAIGNFSGGITNSGLITAGMYGIGVGGNASTDVNVNGTSEAQEAPSFDGTASASITISNFTGGITNSGMILQGVGGDGTIGVSEQVGLLAFARGSGIFVGGVASSGGTVTISTFSGGISNSGLITAGRNGIFVGGIASPGGTVTIYTFSGGIINSGKIVSNDVGIFVGGSAFGDFELLRDSLNQANTTTLTIANFSGGISNFGTILAANHGIWVGGSANSRGTVTISNFSGGISNSGTIVAGGNGIFVGSAVFAEAETANSEAAEAPAEAATATTGVIISTFSGGISNSGMIVAGSAGILVSGVENFSDGISNTGSITGAVGIMVTNSNAVSVFDSGTIVGTSGVAVDLSGNAPGNTFTLGPGYSITGNVVGTGSDTFQLGGTGNGSFNLSSIGSNQQYQGFTTFNVVGGVWNTSGTFDIGMPLTWTVTGGTLAGASTFGTSANPVSMTVANGGTLEPGTPGTPGTFMTITGDLTIQSGAAYAVNINSTTASRANVTGSIFLNGGVVEGVLTPGSYSGATIYDILDPRSISGEFREYFSVNAPGFGGELTEENDPDVLLQLRAQLGSGGGLNQNQQDAATGINNYFNNGGTLPASFFPLFTLTGGNLANALTHVDGEAATGAQTASFQSMNEFLNLLLDPSSMGGGSGGSAAARSAFRPKRQTCRRTWRSPMRAFLRRRRCAARPPRALHHTGPHGARPMAAPAPPTATPPSAATISPPAITASPAAWNITSRPTCSPASA
jgi:hypothetical protein